MDHLDLKSSPDARFKPSGEEEKKDADDPGNKDSKVPSTEEPRVNQEKNANVNSTNTINIVNPTINATGIEDNTVDEYIVYGCVDDPNMPELEDIIYSDDDEDVGAEVDMNNLDAFIPVSPIPTTGIHKDHPIEQISGYLKLAPQTRRMTKKEPKKVIQALKDPRWIEAIQEELLQFKLQQIKEAVTLCPPPGFEDPDFPNRVYKVEKALYGLHQALRAWCETFDVKTASTPIETHKPLLKDADGEDVDERLYRSMIESLMYLTSSRLGIMFAVCACARFQVNPKNSHLYVVKRIFRYLKSLPKLSLWYPIDSPFDLVACINNDYAGASLDKKSTTGGCNSYGVD
ncbi:uncharacterized mitochondrial protein-like protein [Tanacetum coccineum]